PPSKCFGQTAGFAEANGKTSSRSNYHSGCLSSECRNSETAAILRRDRLRNVYMSNKLTPKQIRFIEEFLVDSNGKQAAVRAGYSPKTAHVIASRLLKNPKVKATLARLHKERAQRLQASSDWIIEELITKYRELG